jgi:hypothetical protein
MNGRNAILQGQRPHTGHTAQLQTIDNQLRTVSKTFISQHDFHTPRKIWAVQTRLFNFLRFVDSSMPRQIVLSPEELV